ncbi:CBS domain-containing protein [Aggregicoccus sp. 17bor-14]|uniref:CBS domain-containing protein n=1 Tax=Myxococcaceae TaxID=31 RepID=UPI00129C79EE|nr:MULTISPECIES: CBS domain-containing protein [Myxococcaceae]MBF5045731.1 CBS domain-containing protein [Simulacricoccus sp. 17bor-14]MRI91467.1 CBS domain-containing protein [Aggregicoccus sp. 17bor-14]
MKAGAPAGVGDATPLRDVMTRAVVSVRPEQPVDEALQLLVENTVSGLPVVDAEHRPVGMLSRADVLEEQLDTLRVGAGAQPVRVRDVMTGHALTLPETASVGEAALLMGSYAVHRVPVVDEAGRLVGIVSTLDVLRCLAFRPPR